MMTGGHFLVCTANTHFCQHLGCMDGCVLNGMGKQRCGSGIVGLFRLTNSPPCDCSSLPSSSHCVRNVPTWRVSYEGGETAITQTESSRLIFSSFKGHIMSKYGISAFCVFEGGETARNLTDPSRSNF